MKKLSQWCQIFGVSAFVLILSISFLEVEARADLCKQWSPSRDVGMLDGRLLQEASGVVASRVFPDRLYLHNDSGNDAQLVMTNSQGKSLKTIGVEGFSPKDWEDLGYGACPDKGACLYIADIGDNKEKRKNVQVALVRELENFPASVRPISLLTLQYPDGPHNAEGLAIHPNGDLFILTKVESGPARMYKVSRQDIVAGMGRMIQIKMKPVAEFDLSTLNRNKDPDLRVTGLDIALHGRGFLVLTRSVVFEFNIDLSAMPVKNSRQMEEGTDYQVIRVKPLEQQEAITYLPGDRSFLYTTESESGSKKQPVVRLDCLSR